MRSFSIGSNRLTKANKRYYFLFLYLDICPVAKGLGDQARGGEVPYAFLFGGGERRLQGRC